MTAPTPEATATPEAAHSGTATAPTPAPAPTPPATPEKPAKRSLEDSLANVDAETRDYVLAEVAKARKDAGDARSTAKKQAADEARNELAQSIGRALGLVEDEKVDPAKLTEQLTTEKAAARQSSLELAVYKASVGAGGDPAALLDSRSFLSSLDGVEPGDGKAITAAIAAAVAANQALASAPARRLPAVPGQGASGSGAPDLETQIAAAVKAGDTKTAIHLQNQKLAASFGQQP